MFSILQHWRNMARLDALPSDERTVVFYSEGPAYWPHLDPIIRHFGDYWDRPFCYVSSDPRDPGLSSGNSRMHCFCIGAGMVRNVFFRSLQAGVVVMTMPDLDTLEIKRSRFPVHYVFVPHSMASKHMIYRKGAFDHFDTVFCAGPHHMAEIRETESLYGLPQKNLFAAGYGRLDKILEARAASAPPREQGLPEVRNVLVAPSWGPEGLLETCGVDLVKVLVDAGYDVTVRPHPQTKRLRPDALEALVRQFAANDRFHLEEDMATQKSLHACDIMISDWSGVALEFAFGIGRPVLFVDTARKVNNPDYLRYDSVPIEVFIREQIGRVVSPQELDRVPAIMDELAAKSGTFSERVRTLREQHVFNVGQSGREGAAHIAELARKSGSIPAVDDSTGHDR